MKPSSPRPGPTLFITSDFPPLPGGVANYLHHLALLLDEPPLILTSRMAGAAAFDRAQPYRVVRAPVDAAAAWQRKLLLGPAWVWLSARLVRQHRPRLAVGGFASPQVLLSLAWLRRRYRLQTALIAHGGDLCLLQKPGPLRAIERRWLHSLDRLVANSQFTADLLVSRLGLPPERVRVFRPGIDFARFQQPGTIPLPHWPAARKKILSVGRLVAYKGFDRVLQAVAGLVERGLDVGYIIVGAGPDRPRLERLAASLRLEQRVHFAGSVPDEALPRYYNTCHLFALVSREEPARGAVEGFGIVCLEANACGKPVVGSRSGGIGEAIIDEQTGLLVAPTDIPALGQALHRLLTDEALAHRLGAQGRRRARRQFDWANRRPAARQALGLAFLPPLG